MLKLALGSLVLVAGLAHGAQATLGAVGPISPGDPVTGARTSGRCPTFSWVADPKAKGYELVVLSLVDTPPAAGSAMEIPALRIELPAGASSWTPSTDRCLEPAGRYAWTIRPVGPEVVDWPQARLFEIEAAPSSAELEDALEVLERARDAGRLTKRVERDNSQPVSTPNPSSTDRAPAIGEPAVPGLLTVTESSVVDIASPSHSGAGDLRVHGHLGFSEPRDGSVHISGNSFLRQVEGDDEAIARTFNGYAYITSGSGALTVDFVAPVFLPNGATVLTFGCQYYDSSSTSDLDPLENSGTLYRRDRQGIVGETMATVAMGIGNLESTTSAAETFTNAITNGEIDTKRDSHYIHVHWQPPAIGFGFRFYGCRVSYEVVNLEP